MPKKTRGDKFVNKARFGVTQSAANTLTFQELQTGVAIFDKVAWVISKIEYYFGFTNLTEMATDGEYMDAIITTTNTLASVDMTSPALIDRCTWYYSARGTAASHQFFGLPLIKDFSSLPNGGLIVAPSPLYIGLASSGLATAGVVQAWAYFQYLTLTPNDYWELVESNRVIV